MQSFSAERNNVEGDDRYSLVRGFNISSDWCPAYSSIRVEHFIWEKTSSMFVTLISLAGWWGSTDNPGRVGSCETTVDRT